MSLNNHEDNIKVLALVRYCGIKPRALEQLLKHFSSLEELIEAEEQALATIAGVTAETAARIADTDKYLQQATDYHTELSQRNINITTRLDKDYPRLLFELNDPPSLLYSRGNLPDNNLKTVALVGTPDATNEGITLTTKLAKSFASAGVQIISSLGRGNDYAAHLGSRAGAGKSFAVLDGGFDNLSESDEMPVAIDIAGTGGVISEYAPDESFNENNCNASNRIIAGLAQAVVITELYQDSRRIHDLLEFCLQIGKLTFILADPKFGALFDEKSLALATERGAVPMTGFEKVNDIIKSLV